MCNLQIELSVSFSAFRHALHLYRNVHICFCHYICRWSSVYLITLWIILRRELLKFLLIALLLIVAFSAALRFAVQAERDHTSRVQRPSPSQMPGFANNMSNNASTVPLTEHRMLTSFLLGGLE